MIIGKVKFEFTSGIWQTEGKGGWYFVSLPEDMSKEIRHHLGGEEEGWGRLKAIAQVGNTQWSTAIWFDTKRNTYLLPLKSVIRKKESLEAKQNLHVVLYI